MLIPRPNLLNAAIIVAIVGAMAWAQDDDARADADLDLDSVVAQEEADALTSREWAGQQICGPTRTAVWDDDKSMRCLRNIDAPRAVAAGERP